jgi:hypothetical protein
MQKLLFPTLRDDLPESLWRNNPHCRCQTISLPNNNGYPAIFFWQSCRDLLFFAKSGLLMRLGTIFYCTRRSVNAATSVRRRARLRAVERAARRRAARFGWRQFEWRKFERGSRRRRPGPGCRSDLSRSRPFAPKRTQPPVRSHCLAPSPVLFATHGGRRFVSWKYLRCSFTFPQIELRKCLGGRPLSALTPRNTLSRTPTHIFLRLRRRKSYISATRNPARCGK